MIKSNSLLGPLDHVSSFTLVKLFIEIILSQPPSELVHPLKANFSILAKFSTQIVLSNWNDADN